MMIRRVFAANSVKALFVVWALSSFASNAHALSYTLIQSQSDGDSIPVAPGSVGVSGKVVNRSNAATAFITIKEMVQVNGVWETTGPILSSGSSVVSGTSPKYFAATLNSPAVSGKRYLIFVNIFDANGNHLDDDAKWVVAP